MARIQRQYSLPNCTLVLDGMDDPTQSNAMELRPIMTMLLNAECHLGAGIPPIAGGREFLDNLVQAVSQYAQEFLSGITPVASGLAKAGALDIKRLQNNLHQLTYPKPGAADGSNSSATVQLTTVQLFDLVEAIDQFIADTQTLPGWSLNLQPVSKKFAPQANLSKQAVPAAVGLSGLAIAAAAIFVLPTPQIKQPEDLRPGTPNAATPAPSNAASTPPDTKSIQADLTAVPPITDPGEVAKIQAGLAEKLKDFQANDKIKTPLEYRVSVAKDGTIVGFKHQNDASLSAINETPLQKLLFIPTADKKPEAIADYRVVFMPDGKVDIQPWSGASSQTPGQGTASLPTPIASPSNAPTSEASPSAAPASSPSPSVTPTSAPPSAPPSASPLPSPIAGATGAEITDAQALEALQPKVYEQLDQAWKVKPSFNEDLKYRVQVGADGKIVSYESDNRAARDYENEIPLPQLGKPQDNASAPVAGTASFKVVFKPSGKLEISPWHGFSKP